MTVKHDKKEDFVINRDKKYGGDLKFKDYDELEKAYVNKIIHPLDLKNAVAKEINLMLKLIRANINILKEYSKKAYSK
jgi:tyrosyl-tRNA synthetase